MLALGLALVGVVTLWLPAFRFRVDAASCAAWPALPSGVLLGAAYAVAIALLAVAWLRAQKLAWPLSRLLLAAAAVHALALVAPPFASNDALYYAAIGRAMARFHASPAAQLSTVLPPGDPFLQALPSTWRDGTSPYGPGFNQLARVIALVAGDRLMLQLKLYQALSALAILVTAWLAGRTAGTRAAALVAFCPLAIVDGTINAHNDALQAPLFAACALLLARRRELPALVAAAATLLVKLSGALLLGFLLLRLLLRPLAPRMRTTPVVVAGAIASTLAIAALVLAMDRFPAVDAFTALVGSPLEQYPHFTRSFEALPRAYLVYVAHLPLAAWILGLAFRAAAGLWLLYAALRAAREDSPLAWAATALLTYYLFFHAYVQGWYVIPLLPLAPHLPERLRPVFAAFAIGLALYYALQLPLDCVVRPSVVGAKEFFEAAIVLLPAYYVLMRRARRAGRGRASA